MEASFQLREEVCLFKFDFLYYLRTLEINKKQGQILISDVSYS